MAVRRTMVRLGAVIVGLSALGVTLPTLASSQHKPGKHQAPARKAGVQKCCDVRLRDAFGAVTSIGEPASVTATVAATRTGCTNVHPRITVSLAGLDPDEIRIERVVRGTPLSLAVRPAGDGAVRAADPVRDRVRLCGDGRANLAYRLTFLAAAPGSDADSPSATQRGSAARPARLPSAAVAAGLGALVVATIGLVGVLALRGRREDPTAGPAGPARSPGRHGSQPTLAARWSSLVRSVRRPSTPAGEQS